MSTMKLCGVTTLLDRNKYKAALWCHKLCGATALLYGKKYNEYNEALWCHNIVERVENEWGQ